MEGSPGFRFCSVMFWCHWPRFMANGSYLFALKNIKSHRCNISCVSLPRKMKAVTVSEERKLRRSLVLKYKLMAKVCCSPCRLVIKGRNSCRNLPLEVVVSQSLDWLQEEHLALTVNGCGKGEEGRGHSPSLGQRINTAWSEIDLALWQEGVE